MSRLAMIGGAGFAAEVEEIAELNAHTVVAYVAREKGRLDLPYWGPMEQLPAHRDEFDHVCIAFSAVDRKTAANRRKVVRWVADQGFTSIALVSPHAIVSLGVSIAPGAIVAHGVVLSLQASIGAFSVINSGAVVGHDARVDENVTIAPMAFLAGNVHAGENTLVGPGALILQGISIGSDCVISVGATVVQNLDNGATVAPARSRVHQRAAEIPV